MKKLIMLWVLILFLSACASTANGAEECNRGCPDSGWNLVWYGPDGIHTWERVCKVNFEHMQYDILKFCTSKGWRYVKGGAWQLGAPEEIK